MVAKWWRYALDLIVLVAENLLEFLLRLIELIR
jgi:hypothetical protein